ncbi:MAG TPA: carboxypeptidase-like regulatory domain-containing protein, partial [Chitinophagaceae bacterium]
MKKYFPIPFFNAGFQVDFLTWVTVSKGISKKLSFAAGLMILCLPIFAQQITVQGKVVDSQTQGVLPGATVTIIGKPGGFTADNNGSFTINAAVGDQLSVQSVGYTPALVTLTGSSNITVQLNVSVQSLDDVVVIGYGTSK